MTKEQHLICETVQEMTLQAYPVLYGRNNHFDRDSRDVLETIREWGDEFEKWYQSHDADWIADQDYLQEIDDFTEKKLAAELRNELTQGRSDEWLVAWAKDWFSKMSAAATADRIRKLVASELDGVLIKYVESFIRKQS